jgi:predicted RNA-binding Zn-ribbon protein involved in translation (DUF1610 family)
MNFTDPFNQEPKETIKQENEGNLLSFSFSLEEPKKASPEQLLETVKSKLQSILNDKFSNYEKRRVDPKIGRLNFACPYCGDSHADTWKKRGNIYTQSFYYKCYNCGKYRNLAGFLKDFGYGLDIEETLLANELQEAGKPMSRTVDPMVLHDTEELIKWSIEREEIEQKFKLVRLDNSKIFTYMKKRLQPDMTKFSWNHDAQQLYIFHIVPGTTRVLGYQIRNFVHRPKYLTFKLSRIYEELGKNVCEEVLALDDISTTFGILEMDITKPVTVFEGPLDAFLYKNSLATCSSNIDSPIQLSTLRYMYDYDSAGKEAALEKLSQGKSVFLWRKLFKEIGMDDTGKKVDLTDLVVLAKRKGVRLPKLSNYFSDDKYDSYWI